MDEASDDQAARAFLATVRVGDVCSGIAAEVTRLHVAVTLDGFPARPLGSVGPLDLSWGYVAAPVVQVGDRVTAEVIAVDLEAGRVQLSMAATENPELWAFLKSLPPGRILSGRVAAIERFGVFVALDDGPAHPVFPGVGFITVPDLSWRHVDAISDVVRVGQRVSCKMVLFDTSKGEARLSLRAMQPDPFDVFADRLTTGRQVRGRVAKLVPFGAFAEVADGVEGLIPLDELSEVPVTAPEEVVQVGDEVSVLVTEFDRTLRRLTLSRRRTASEPR